MTSQTTKSTLSSMPKWCTDKLFSMVIYSLGSIHIIVTVASVLCIYVYLIYMRMGGMFCAHPMNFTVTEY